MKIKINKMENTLLTEIMVLREKNAELVEMLKEAANVIEWYMENTLPDNNHQDFFNIGMNQRDQIESLINSDISV